MQLFSANATIFKKKKNFAPQNIKNLSSKVAHNLTRPRVFRPERFCFVQLRHFFSLKISKFWNFQSLPDEFVNFLHTAPLSTYFLQDKMWRFCQILVAFSEYMNCNLVSFYKNAPNMAWVRYFRVLFLHLGCVKSIFSRLYGRFTIRNASWTCLFRFLFCTFHIRATGIKVIKGQPTKA